jgi:hypothetical protein
VSWTRSFDEELRVRIAVICDSGRLARERDDAWQTLVMAIAPVIESWARHGRVLRRCRLDNDDDARAVMVAVLERLARRDFENLRRFLARQPAAADDEEEASLVEALGRLLRAADDDEAPASDDGGGDERAGTPLRGWLRGLTRFVAKDHVKQRLGWSGAPVEGSKRDLTTDAAPLDDVGEAGARPPITDALMMRRVLGEIRAYLGTLPPPMVAALELWLDERDFAEVAARLGLDGAERARALVRAAQARLRERFRERWPELCA